MDCLPHARRLLIGVVVPALLGSLLLACGTTRAKKGVPPKPVPYHEEVRQAARLSAEQPGHVVRYNPVKCNCPHFEVQLGARWIRLQLEGDKVVDSPAARLLGRAEKDFAAGNLQRYPVIGDLSTSLNRCGQGALFLTLSVAEGSAERAE